MVNLATPPPTPRPRKPLPTPKTENLTKCGWSTKRTDLSVYGPEHLRAVEDELNARPRLVLADHTPAELFSALLASA
jgi:IS30 family transposase